MTNACKKEYWACSNCDSEFDTEQEANDCCTVSEEEEDKGEEE